MQSEGYTEEEQLQSDVYTEEEQLLLDHIVGSLLKFAEAMDKVAKSLESTGHFIEETDITCD